MLFIDLKKISKNGHTFPTMGKEMANEFCVIGDSAYFLTFVYLNLPEKVYKWGEEKSRIFCG
jgi:hypothetical protein